MLDLLPQSAPDVSSIHNNTDLANSTIEISRKVESLGQHWHFHWFHTFHLSFTLLLFGQPGGVRTGFNWHKWQLLPFFVWKADSIISSNHNRFVEDHIWTNYGWWVLSDPGNYQDRNQNMLQITQTFRCMYDTKCVSSSFSKLCFKNDNEIHVDYILPIKTGAHLERPLLNATIIYFVQLT